MDAKTAEALEASIKHWQENVAAETPDGVSLQADHCALCRIFFYEKNCRGCPVFARTGEQCCNESPYRAAEYWFEQWKRRPDSAEIRAEWRQTAQKEVDFLISLRDPTPTEG